MPIENLNDREPSPDDLMGELAKLPLSPAEKLATYLKITRGAIWWAMSDEDWLQEAKELLKAIGGKET